MREYAGATSFGFNLISLPQLPAAAIKLLIVESFERVDELYVAQPNHELLVFGQSILLIEFKVNGLGPMRILTISS